MLPSAAYRGACPEKLFIHLMMTPEFRNGSLHEVCNLLELAVTKYLEETRDQPTHACIKPQASVTPQTQPHLAHPISHYYQAQNPLPYYLSPAGKHIRELFTKENCCNDCRKVGHNFKTCPNHCGPTRVNSRSVDNHKVLIQELTSQLDEHLQLEMTIDLDETMYTLFHPPLVIQASAAACNKPSGCCPLGQ